MNALECLAVAILTFAGLYFMGRGREAWRDIKTGRRRRPKHGGK